jgi:hypothetical protein
VVVLVAKLEIVIIFLLFYIAWAMMNNVVFGAYARFCRIATDVFVLRTVEDSYSPMTLQLACLFTFDPTITILRDVMNDHWLRWPHATISSSHSFVFRFYANMQYTTCLMNISHPVLLIIR